MTEKEQGKTTSKIAGEINAEMMKTTRATQSLTDRMVQEIESLRQQLVDFKNMGATEACAEIPAVGEYVAQVEQQLADHIKREVMLRDALEAQVARDKRVSYERCFDCDYPQKCSHATGCLGIKDHSPIAKKALAATDDLGGLILCEKEPVAEVKKHTGSLKDMAIIVWSGEQPAEGTQLYRAWEPKP